MSTAAKRPVGRPPAELEPSRRRELERLARREADLAERLRVVRAELVTSAVQARQEGASRRAIARATGLSITRVAELTAPDAGGAAA